MSDPNKVTTRFGMFDQARLDKLNETIKGQDREAVVKFEGADLHVGFGRYLAEYVEGELSKRNAGL